MPKLIPVTHRELARKNRLADLGLPSTLSIPTVVQGKRMAISTAGTNSRCAPIRNAKARGRSVCAGALIRLRAALDANDDGAVQRASALAPARKNRLRWKSSPYRRRFAQKRGLVNPEKLSSSIAEWAIEFEHCRRRHP